MTLPRRAGIEHIFGRFICWYKSVCSLMDRVLDYGSRGCRFEFCWVCKFEGFGFWGFFQVLITIRVEFCFCGVGLSR